MYNNVLYIVAWSLNSLKIYILPIFWLNIFIFFNKNWNVWFANRWIFFQNNHVNLYFMQYYVLFKIHRANNFIWKNMAIFVLSSDEECTRVYFNSSKSVTFAAPLNCGCLVYADRFLSSPMYAHPIQHIHGRTLPHFPYNNTQNESWQAWQP